MRASASRTHGSAVKKAVAVAMAAAAIGVLVRRIGPKMGDIDWEKTFEAMPDNAPPKWMFRNITAIRENTEKILDALGSERSATAPGT